MYLLPSTVGSDEISRLIIVEEVEGPKISITATGGSVLVSSNTDRHVEVTFLVDDQEENPDNDLHKKIREFLDKTIKVFLQANADIEELVASATLMMPDKYLIVAPTMVLESMFVRVLKEGEKHQLEFPPSMVADYAPRLGFFMQNIFPLPTQLGIALKHDDVGKVNKLRKKLRSIPSMHGKYGFKPKYSAILSEYQRDGEKGRRWTL